jgi:preprotein translocase subunit SecA
VDRFIYTESGDSLETRATNLADWIEQLFSFRPENERLLGLRRDEKPADLQIDDVLVRPQSEIQAAVWGVLEDALTHNRLQFSVQRYEQIVREAIALQVDRILFSETLAPAAPSRARRLAEWLYHQLTVEVDPREILKFIKDELAGNDPRRDELEDFLFERCKKRYEEIEEEQGAETMRLQERFVMLEVIDRRWKDHLRDMDHLKEGIWLESYGGKDPKMRYKKQGWHIFTEMLQSTYDQIAELVFKVRLRVTEDINRDLAGRFVERSAGRGDVGGLGDQNQRDREAAERAGKTDKVETFRRTRKRVKPNDPCWCGSGKKYKHCHRQQDRAGARA